jgi:hypothetical protein
MSLATPPGITELIDDLLRPAVAEPDYITSSRMATELLLPAWSAWAGRGLPSVTEAERDFRAALLDEGDLTPAQVSALAAKLCPGQGSDLRAWLADAAERLVLRIRPWIPVWAGFTWWALEWCRHAGRDQVIFLGRDGLPFYAAARYMPSPGSFRLSILDAPRRLLGSPVLNGYLAARVDRGRPATFVDTGCYGTVVTSLARYHSRGGAGEAATLFLTSRNPRIFGYLNYIMSWRLLLAGPAPGRGPMDFTVYGCDLVEALPKPYTVVVGDDGVWRVPSDVVSFVLAMRTCVEIARYTHNRRTNPTAEAAVAAEELYRMFQNCSDALLLDSCAPKNPPLGPVLAELGISGLPPQSDIFGLAYG